MSRVETPRKLLGTIKAIEIDEILNKFCYIINGENGENVYNPNSLVHYETISQKEYKEKLQELIDG